MSATVFCPQIYRTIKKSQSPVTNTNYFAKLSDELILAVLKYLSKVSLVRCGKVCKRLNRLSKDESLWKRLDLGGKRLEESILHRLINRNMHILRLARAEIIYEHLDYRRMAMCRLQYLDLSMLLNPDVVVVRAILFRCRSLVALSLESCNVDDETCDSISRNPNLRLLNLALCRGLSADGIADILQRCTKLMELHLGWTSMDRETVQLAVSMFPHTLRRLNISGCRCGSMSDDDVLQITSSCPYLSEVDISDCTDLTGKSLAYLDDNLPSLRVLSCSRCYSIDPNAYTAHCRRLKELNILGTIKEESMPILKRALSKVEINSSYFSTIGRPTVGVRRSSIWEHATRDD